MWESETKRDVEGGGFGNRCFWDGRFCERVVEMLQGCAQ